MKSGVFSLQDARRSGASGASAAGVIHKSLGLAGLAAGAAAGGILRLRLVSGDGVRWRRSTSAVLWIGRRCRFAVVHRSRAPVCHCPVWRVGRCCSSPLDSTRPPAARRRSRWERAHGFRMYGDAFWAKRLRRWTNRATKDRDRQRMADPRCSRPNRDLDSPGRELQVRAIVARHLECASKRQSCCHSSLSWRGSVGLGSGSTGWPALRSETGLIAEIIT